MLQCDEKKTLERIGRKCSVTDGKAGGRPTTVNDIQCVQLQKLSVHYIWQSGSGPLQFGLVHYKNHNAVCVCTQFTLNV